MKRIFDITLAATLLMMLFPLLSVVAISIIFTSGVPIFFTQIRTGKDNKPFRMIKFRTLVPPDSKFPGLSDQHRLTKAGHFFRRHSIDELPQLLNILLGHMSFVGPRPLPVKYIDLYSVTQLRRHEVRPGLTGWAQVNGRNLLTWDQKFRCDVWYVDNRSFWLDLKIIMLTFREIVKPRSIDLSHEFPAEFEGNKKIS